MPQVCRASAIGFGAKVAKQSCVNSWKRQGSGWATVDDPGALCDQEASDVVAFHGAAYATGFDYYYDQLPVWRTSDARRWTLLSDDTFVDDGRMFEGAAAIEWHGRLLIIGTAFGDAVGPDGVIWLGTP